MQYLFPHFVYGPLLWALTISFLLGLSGYLLVFKTRLFDSLKQMPLVPDLLIIPVFVLSLILTMMTSHVWENNKLANDALDMERQSIENLENLPIQSQQVGDAIRVGLINYVQLVIEVEWKTYYNVHKTTEVNEALDNLYSIFWKADDNICEYENRVSGCFSERVLDRFQKNLENIELSRSQRILIGSQVEFQYLKKWIIIYLLTLLSVITICVALRADKKIAMFALIVFCSSTFLVFSLIVAHIHPYTGLNALDPTILTFEGH
jgi:hypothetical protein